MTKAVRNKAHAKSHMADARSDAMVAASAISSASVPSSQAGDAAIDEAIQRRQVCDFIRAMSAELSVLAQKNGFEDLAMIFETARQTAEAETEVSDRSREGY